MQPTMKTTEAGTIITVLAYIKGDKNSPDEMHIVCPELGTQVRLTVKPMIRAMVNSPSPDDLMVRFFLSRVDAAQMKHDDATDAPGGFATFGKLNSLFLSSAEPADQGFIKDAERVMAVTCTCSNPTTMATFSDAVFPAPTMEEMLGDMQGEDLLFALAQLMSRAADKADAEPSSDNVLPFPDKHTLH